ncbi:Pyruvate/2-oxoglutarate dehydrogenase complex, dihydrolipoamide acyltransferase (E2) component [Halalkaliarchaeum sp. AArc-CO]|uniref:lipoyl domain-containing protein n=1 Tax=unclassified Halalkaliarchaeum TaxID=2678344 RepID=UPI00217D747B|nr:MULTISPECIES: lipoyl domain-containing protein [unclassified Halalkaliarchaeum]MDR5673815.1 lipoyl domain-containing protein [Halalkaliarchaeum sp. AArc-GB]UWG50973.1 Pyruvate/2-oxoglutarate dehydrogenase complex, dihydrolipoamide acyltransferase (E2) component [Halalkaliarchaeum sp. AArc-CO]
MSGERVAVLVDDHWPADVESEEGVVVNWFLREGATVEAGDPLCELQVEKVSFDVSAPVSGKLEEIHLLEDEEFTRGATLAVLAPA